jgi:hypothetical protein
MQIHFLKFPVILLIFLISKTQLAFSQEVESEIKIADSLFHQKKYTEAFKIYEKCYLEKKVYSPQMLIKMAFIQEGLNNYSKTLFYLNDYYQLTNDKKAMVKMEELAEKHQLKGYEYSDFKFIFDLIRFYKTQITFLFVLLVSILVAWILFSKYRKGIALRLPAVFTISILLIFLMINLLESFNKTAIVSKNTFLMTGPSSGSDVLEVMKAGNKISVLGEEDIWFKVAIGETKGFVRKGNTQLLQ